MHQMMVMVVEIKNKQMDLKQDLKQLENCEQNKHSR